jgi:hypothetical protein
MKTKNLIAVVLVAATSAAHAQTNLKTAIGDLNYEVGYPTKETVDKLYDEMDFQRACQAYMWSFPAVSFGSVKAGLFRDLGATYNDIVLYQDYLDAKSIYLTGNTSTIYAGSQIDLAKDGPVVFPRSR